jgi:hypothetical protein
MGIAVHCPGGHTLRIKDKYAGKSGKCPRCGAKIRVARAYPINADFVENLLTGSSPKADMLDDGQHVLDDVPTGQSGVSLLGPVLTMSQKDN